MDPEHARFATNVLGLMETPTPPARPQPLGDFRDPLQVQSPRVSLSCLLYLCFRGVPEGREEPLRRSRRCQLGVRQ